MRVVQENSRDTSLLLGSGGVVGYWGQNNVGTRRGSVCAILVTFGVAGAALVKRYPAPFCWRRI